MRPGSVCYRMSSGPYGSIGLSVLDHAIGGHHANYHALVTILLMPWLLGNFGPYACDGFLCTGNVVPILLVIVAKLIRMDLSGITQSRTSLVGRGGQSRRLSIYGA